MEFVGNSTRKRRTADLINNQQCRQQTSWKIDSKLNGMQEQARQREASMGRAKQSQREQGVSSRMRGDNKPQMTATEGAEGTAQSRQEHQCQT